MASCRSCSAPITWAKTPAGKAIPLDPKPVPDGNLVLLPGAGKELEAITFDEAVHAGRDRFVSHFATCPNAATHRKHGGRK